MEGAPGSICPFMSDSSHEVKCKEDCMLYIGGPSKNCILSRLPIYYNQMREQVSELAKKVNALDETIKRTQKSN